ncbi:hypothetical protein QQ045_025234 [Rhodiola kirilowii]
MSDQNRSMQSTQSFPHSRQTAKFITATLLGASMIILSGLTLTGTVIGLTIATPLFVIFSPVLVPALIATLMIISGFLFAGGCGAAALVGFTWLYSYTTGKQPFGTSQIDYMKDEIGGKARDMKEFVKDYAKAGQINRVGDQDVRRT